MADQQETGGEIGEIFLEPFDRRDVEMVRRLVEKQDVRLADDRPREADAPPLAAREIDETSVGRDIDGVERRLDAIARLALGGGRQALCDEGGCRQIRIEHRFLRHIGDGGARLLEALAAVELDEPGKCLEQRRLAAAVAADEAGAIALAERERDAGEGRPSAECDARVAQRDERRRRHRGNVG